MDETVGFGWTRKSKLGPQTTWGLFAIPAVELDLVNTHGDK